MFRKFAVAKQADKVLGYSLIAALLSFGLSAQASPPLYTMYRYDVAATGSCIKQVSRDPKTVLERNGITWKGSPSNAEISALARGIGQVERLLGTSLPDTWQTPYNYVVAKGGKWNQGASAINVRRPRGGTGGQNVGRLMHELGHKVGNVGGGDIYAAYQEHTKGSDCKITGYAKTKNNEEFAEVFAAYVTYPDLLNQSCAKAFDFMAKKLFPNSRSALATCGGTIPTATLADSEEPSMKPEDVMARNRVMPMPPLNRKTIAEQNYVVPMPRLNRGDEPPVEAVPEEAAVISVPQTYPNIERVSDTSSQGVQ